MAIGREWCNAFDHVDRIGRSQRQDGVMLRPCDAGHEAQPVGHRMTAGQALQPIGAARKECRRVRQDDRDRLTDRLARRIANAAADDPGHRRSRNGKPDPSGTL